MTHRRLDDHLSFDCLPETNRKDLHYFLSLQAHSFPDGPAYTAERWDQRADFWEQERRKHQKNDERAEDALKFLMHRGILTRDSVVADIGCGPGRFAAAFAREVRSVVGFDLSEKMVTYGNAYLQSLGIQNAQLHCRDFNCLDIQKEGCEKSFDLVFASMTPVLHSPAGLEKAMAMSRGWCMSISHIRRENLLRHQILREVFGYGTRKRGEGRNFYALFNILFLLGYEPETSFFSRQKITRAAPDEEYAAHILEHELPQKDHTPENVRKIRNWLRDHVEEDGLLTEVSDGVYGRILWDVRRCRERPDYRSLLEQEVSPCMFF